MGLFTQLLSLNWLARRLLTICKKSWQRTSNSDVDKERCIKEHFLNCFMLAVFISPVKFSKMVFAVWDCVQSFTTKTMCISCCMVLKSLESDFSTLNWVAESKKIREVYSTEILLNTATIKEVVSTKIDSNVTTRETQYYAPVQRQATNYQKNSQNFKTLNWIYSQWLSLPFLSEQR